MAAALTLVLAFLWFSLLTWMEQAEKEQWKEQERRTRKC